jgi:hypothetical protein
MAKISFEEKGLLRILERIRAGTYAPMPTVRVALIRRGLIEPDETAKLSELGELVLQDLRRWADQSFISSIANGSLHPPAHFGGRTHARQTHLGTMPMVRS